MKPCPVCEKEHTKKGIYCGDPCKQDAYRARQAGESINRNERNRNNRNSHTVTSAPERGRSVQQSIGEIITEHNAAFKFKILSVNYTLDQSIWKPFKSKGTATGKFTSTAIRKALGFTYHPDMKGKKPPVSMVKGKATDIIEVYINQESTEKEIWGLLKHIREFLILNLQADRNTDIQWPPEPFRWRTGPEAGQPRRDYTVKSPLVEEIRDKEPELIGTQAPMRPTDKHENAKMGDGSHDNKIECNSLEQADIYEGIQKTAGAFEKGIPREKAAVRVSEAGNDILHIRDTTDVIDEKAEMHGLSEGNISTAILRAVKEGNAKSDIDVIKIFTTIDRAAQAIEGQSEVVEEQTKVMDTFTRENASHTKLMQNGAEAAESLKVAADAILQVVGPLVEAANKIKEASQQPYKKYERFYKRRKK